MEETKEASCYLEKSSSKAILNLKIKPKNKRVSLDPAVLKPKFRKPSVEPEGFRETTRSKDRSASGISLQLRRDIQLPGNM